jgi:ELWxxDGT repeat protein
MAARHPAFSLATALPVHLAILLAVLPAALPAAPYLVKDLNTVPPFYQGRIDFKGRAIGEGIAYFAAADPAHGVELWRSDGTPGGTERLTDICAGFCGASPTSITVHEGRVFFTADDGFSGSELWLSDGTPGSERRVRDLCPGACSFSPGPVEAVGDRLLFFPYLPEEPGRVELWQTDGTREGTARVKALCTADCGVFSDLLPIGGRGVFFLSQAGRGQELWVTDGTAAGTRALREISPLGGDTLIPGDGFAWIWAADGLWRTDGTTAGTLHIKPLEELAEHPDQASLSRTVFWHGLLFAVLNGGELIRSDGTPEGTFRIAKYFDGLSVGSMAPLDSELLFQVRDFPFDKTVLWRSRGTADTTGPKLDLELPENSGGLTALGGDRAVFPRSLAADDKDEIWVTDGTTAGTRQLAVSPALLHDGTFYLTGDGRAFYLRDSTEDDLWITDGTEAGTHQVRSFRDAPGSSGPQEQAALGEKLVFSAQVPPYLEELLFASDGTAAGTGLLSGKATSAFSFFRFGDRLLFSASRPGGYPPGMWETDGTPGGTALVSHTGFSNPVLFGGQILFGGRSGFGTELMKTDGRSRGVELVKDIDPFIVEVPLYHHQLCEGESSRPVFAGVVGGRLLFAADDGRSGRELWATDGTLAGTVRVRDIHPGRMPGQPTPCIDLPQGPHRPDTGLSSDPQGFVILGSVALFSADDGLRGRELWISNGTFPGTRRVADLVPGPRGSAPHDLVRFHDRVYFLAGNPGEPGQGESLWKTDGTAQGTTRVLDLTLDGLPSWGRNLTLAAGRLFFTVYNETTGAELWASTGDTSGTGLITDLNPGPGNASPQSLTAVGNLLLFAADDGLTGLEPWRSDGTAAGTVRVGDINPGRDASSPGPFTALPTLVMTGADDGAHGRELWAIPRTDIGRPPG